MDFGEIFGFIVPIAERLSILRAILGIVLVFFIPGFAWTLVFFSRLNIIERIVLSIGLSIAIVTLGVLVLNVLLHVRITGANSLFTIILITVVALAIYFLKRFLRK